MNGRQLTPAYAQPPKPTMKRSISVLGSSSNTNNNSDSQPEAAAQNEAKRLKGIELHPLLSSASSTGSLVSRTDALSLQSMATAAAAARRENPYLAHLKEKSHKKRPERVAFLDKRLPSEPASHRPRPLKFKTPGQASEEAERQRQAALQRHLQREIAQLTAEADDLIDADIVADLLEETANSNEPLAWWDAPFVNFAGDTKRTINFDMLGNLIQRPSLRFMTASSSSRGASAPNATPLNIYLTKEERKKLRRQRRLEAQRELQEKIALGLLPPPPPKVKLSSLPRMLAQPGNQLGNESVMDPTRLAAEIKAQSEARAAAHEEANKSRALTPEERAAKKYRKFAELDASSVHVAVFRINDRFEDGAIRFKVLKNAEQNHLHGRLIVGPEFSLLVAEGGPKGIKRYCHLLQERMLKQTFPGWAQLLWRGEQPERDTFGTDDAAAAAVRKPFVMLTFTCEFDAEEAAKAAGVHSHWKLAKSRSS